MPCIPANLKKVKTQPWIVTATAKSDAPPYSISVTRVDRLTTWPSLLTAQLSLFSVALFYLGRVKSPLEGDSFCLVFWS